MKSAPSWQKSFLTRQADKKGKHEKERREKRKKLRYIQSIIKAKNRLREAFDDHPEDIPHKNHKAPRVFSLRDNPASVIAYLEEAQGYLLKKIPVFFNLNEVEVMGPETLAYLCAKVTDRKFTRNTPLNGNFPKDKKLRAMIKQSGFLDLLKKKGKFQEEYLESRLVHRVVHEKVEPILAGKIVESANFHTFGVKRTNIKSLYPILIECMANTKNHASYGKGSLYDWWIIAYQEQDTKITKFCFLDVGIGIFGSLRSRYSDGKLTGWLRRVLTLNDQVASISKILHGQNETSTDQEERGLGLNYIYSLVRRDPSIRNFTLISNSVVASIGYNMDDQIKKIESEFFGTMYCWELIPT